MVLRHPRFMLSPTLSLKSIHPDIVLNVFTFLGKWLCQPLYYLLLLFTHQDVQIKLQMFDRVLSSYILGIQSVVLIVEAAVLEPK